MQELQEQRLLPLTELLSYLPVEQSTLYRWVRTGVVRAIRVGGRYFIAEAELRRVVTSGSARVDG